MSWVYPLLFQSPYRADRFRATTWQGSSDRVPARVSVSSPIRSTGSVPIRALHHAEDNACVSDVTLTTTRTSCISSFCSSSSGWTCSFLLKDRRNARHPLLPVSTILCSAKGEKATSLFLISSRASILVNTAERRLPGSESSSSRCCISTFSRLMRRGCPCNVGSPNQFLEPIRLWM